MALPLYSTGTVTVGAGGTTVTGAGTIWTGGNVSEGESIYIGASSALIVEVVSATQLTITPWPGAAQAGVAYKVYQNSPRRFDDVQVADDLRSQVSSLNKSGFFHFVAPGEAAPDPSLGDELQIALQESTGKTWQKQSGLWVLVASPYGLQAAQALSEIAALGLQATALTNLGGSSVGKSLFGAADAPTARTNIGAQAALGFPPVQQGTGIDQLPNAVKIGWSNLASLLATVDSVNLGKIWTDYIIGKSATANGYVKFADALLVQWGISTNGSTPDYNQPFPIAFPTACVAVFAQVAYSSLAATSAYLLSADNYDSASPTLFSVRKRRVDNGGTVSAVADGIRVQFLAIGF